jgi:hypothetical protein
MQKSGMWARAAEMAAQTPAERNRYVDLLRALSIGAVVLGHWIMAAPHFQAGIPSMDHLLEVQPWSRWLTWLFQVMPVFFFVGGFSNGVSWDSAQKKNQRYSYWLESRMRRLLGPVIPLVFLWGVLGVIGYLSGVHPKFIEIGSQVSLVPVWFLAIYFVIVMLVPLTRAAWHRYGLLSAIVPFVLAIGGDWLFFNTPYQSLAWFNYLFVWGAVHQLGYAWQQGKLGGVTSSVCIAVLGATTLILLTQFGPYPTSLVGVPGQAISNTTPPKLPLVALGLTQIGLLLALEGPMRRWLAKARVWTATVLVNGLIMPIFLWHSTVMMLLIGFCFWVIPNVFFADPGTTQWWAIRPAWVVVYFTLMMLGLPLFLWLEKIVGSTTKRHNHILVVIICAALTCTGLAFLAAGGVTGNGPMGINWLAVCLPLIGAIILSALGRQIDSD